MGAPVFEPEKIPLLVTEQADKYQLEVDGQQINFGAVSMGNPHAVIEVTEIANAPVETLGPLIENHAMFPERVNVGFMHCLTRDHIQLRVFERGVGETLACGSGACAAVAYGISQGWLDQTVTVDLAGGDLEVSWAGEEQPVMMTGPAVRVFDGVFYV
jgi:diaminopimelate epimerase